MRISTRIRVVFREKNRALVVEASLIPRRGKSPREKRVQFHVVWQAFQVKLKMANPKRLTKILAG